MAVLCSIEGLGCADCRPRNNTAEEFERVLLEQERKGCRKPAPSPQYADPETGKYFYRCPVSQVWPESIQFLELYHHYEAGFLLVEGGILDQPAGVMERFRVIRHMKFMWLEHKNKKGEK